MTPVEERLVEAIRRVLDKALAEGDLQVAKWVLERRAQSMEVKK